MGEGIAMIIVSIMVGCYCALSVQWCQQVGSMVFARVENFPFIEEWSSHV